SLAVQDYEYTNPLSLCSLFLVCESAAAAATTTWLLAWELLNQMVVVDGEGDRNVGPKFLRLAI
ncbi:hypothetical protein M8C21_002541, partial [Ambrosia artemisiifolia]